MIRPTPALEGTEGGSPKVVVLMSTFNGSKFVIAQVTSILGQLPRDGQLMIRDDGSTDDTVPLIDALADPRVLLSKGRNIGFGASFLTLLASTPKDVDLVMFSDQDDIWLPGKIQRAWESIRKHGAAPALYCSAQRLVDESLKEIGTSGLWPRGPSFTGALAENIVTGCTAALNRQAAILVARAGVPTEVRFHDWWMYLVVSALGTVVVDDHPTLLYRQHRSNVIGRGSGWWDRHFQMVRFLWRNDWAGILVNQVAAFWRCYGDALTEKQKDLLRCHFEVTRLPSRPRWRLVVSARRWRQYRAHELFFRCLVAAKIAKTLWDQVMGPNFRTRK